MIADALKLIQSTAQQAASAAGQLSVIELPKEPDRYAIVSADGSFEIRDAAPPPRAHVLGSLDQVDDFVASVSERFGATPTVWYDGDGIVVVIHDTEASQRRDAAKLKFRPTSTWTELCHHAEEWLPQKEFVRFLRITLADAATDSSRQLLRVCRVIGFSNSAGVASTVEHGRQSLGRDIEQQVKSEVGDLPEEITLNVRIFDDPSLTRRFAIRCAVDVEPRNATFNLCPLPGALGDAVDEQLDLIGRELTDSVECPVFRGKP